MLIYVVVRVAGNVRGSVVEYGDCLAPSQPAHRVGDGATELVEARELQAALRAPLVRSVKIMGNTAALTVDGRTWNHRHALQFLDAWISIYQKNRGRRLHDAPCQVVYIMDESGGQIDQAWLDRHP
jgi:hypothetical protein